MPRAETKRRITTFLDDYRIRRTTIQKVGEVECVEFDFPEDLVEIRGTAGSIYLKISMLEQLLADSTVH